MATRHCLLGATNADLAALFEVDVTTIDRWLAEKPEFRGAVYKGREGADADVARSLYQRATGYRHKAVKIVADAKTGAEHIVPYVEHYPPDTAAAFIWLKNRRPDLWRDRQQIDLNVDLTQLTDAQLQRIANGEHPLAVVAAGKEASSAGVKDE